MGADARRAWALAMIGRACREVPAYGSREWLALPDASPEKVAAVVVAAEASIYSDDVVDLETTALARWFNREHYVADEVDRYRRDHHHREMWTGTGFRADPVLAAEIEAEWRAWVRGEVA